MSCGELPTLLECKALMDELGVKRATAERIMRAVPAVKMPDVRSTERRYRLPRPAHVREWRRSAVVTSKAAGRPGRKPATSSREGTRPRRSVQSDRAATLRPATSFRSEGKLKWPSDLKG